MQKGDLAVIVSVVTEAELLVRPERDGNEFAIERIGDLLSEEGIYVVGVDRKIARRAAQLRARVRMALADAIIVATAIETGCDAVVTNDGEWSKKVSEVPIIHLDDIVSRTGGAGRAGDPKES